MMMALGLFVFALETAPYQEFQQQIGWRHPANSRVGLRPARQFLGPDDETVTLSGVLLPELSGGDNTIDLLRSMGDTGRPFVLIEGSGRYYGMFVIEGLTVTRTLFFPDGKARRLEFSLKLQRVDGGLEALIGDAIAGGLGV
ncbi:phage tail protein [Cupriavidus pinatubonensis]|uniref:phage tail protein n=1 Tax=Cupriavidus pinatubonensis TaxID=248026 RepID=UPI0036212751